MTHLYDQEDWDKYMGLAGDQVVLVAFVATYQPFSADIDLTFIKMDKEYKGTAQFMVVEYTEAEDLMEYLNVEVTPTFWVVKNKKKLDGWEGDIDGLREKLEALIKKYS